MVKIANLRTLPTAALNKKKRSLQDQISAPPDFLRASLVRQYLTCGKPNCRCRRGFKHGPFHYLVQCLAGGKVRKFLLKTPAQQTRARAAIAAHGLFLKKLENLSELNTELLRRGEL